MIISELAEACGVNPQTVRYYERRGLLPDPRRAGRGYREYSEEHVRRLRFIKQAQALGFSLKEVSDLFALRVSRRSQCGAVRTKAEAKIEEIDAKIRTLRGFKTALKGLVAQCEETGPRGSCPILENLESSPGGSTS